MAGASAPGQAVFGGEDAGGGEVRRVHPAAAGPEVLDVLRDAVGARLGRPVGEPHDVAAPVVLPAEENRVVAAPVVPPPLDDVPRLHRRP
ncbi:MAG: hypothetical protein ACK56F_01765, partial [bacterium]